MIDGNAVPLENSGFGSGLRARLERRNSEQVVLEAPGFAIEAMEQALREHKIPRPFVGHERPAEVSRESLHMWFPTGEWALRGLTPHGNQVHMLLFLVWENENGRRTEFPLHERGIPPEGYGPGFECRHLLELDLPLTKALVSDVGFAAEAAPNVAEDLIRRILRGLIPKLKESPFLTDVPDPDIHWWSRE